MNAFYLANTIRYPWAVMIKLFHASVTRRAMFGTWRPYYLHIRYKKRLKSSYHCISFGSKLTLKQPCKLGIVVTNALPKELHCWIHSLIMVSATTHTKQTMRNIEIDATLNIEKTHHCAIHLYIKIMLAKNGHVQWLKLYHNTCKPKCTSSRTLKESQKSLILGLLLSYNDSWLYEKNGSRNIRQSKCTLIYIEKKY